MDSSSIIKELFEQVLGNYSDLCDIFKAQVSVLYLSFKLKNGNITRYHQKKV